MALNRYFRECELAFKVLKTEALKSHDLSVKYERKWEDTLSALSQGRYDSSEGLVEFVGSLYRELDSLRQKLKDADAALVEARKDEVPF